MPRRDQTGPSGAGPMTGRGLGLCNNNQSENNVATGRGRQFFRAGRGRKCNGYSFEMAEEINRLRERLDALEK